MRDDKGKNSTETGDDGNDLKGNDRRSGQKVVTGKNGLGDGVVGSGRGNGSSFHKTIVVNEDDLDELNHVNNVRYVQWIQDISKEHWITLAPKSIRDGVIWVVMHHDITYKNAAQLGDEITVSTHVEKSKGAVSVRIVEMHNKKTDVLLVRSRTDWCLLNEKTQRPTRISEEFKLIFR